MLSTNLSKILRVYADRYENKYETIFCEKSLQELDDLIKISNKDIKNISDAILKLKDVELSCAFSKFAQNYFKDHESFVLNFCNSQIEKKCDKELNKIVRMCIFLSKLPEVNLKEIEKIAFLLQNPKLSSSVAKIKGANVDLHRDIVLHSDDAISLIDFISLPGSELRTIEDAFLSKYDPHQAALNSTSTYKNYYKTFVSKINKVYDYVDSNYHSSKILERNNPYFSLEFLSIFTNQDAHKHIKVILNSDNNSLIQALNKLAEKNPILEKAIDNYSNNPLFNLDKDDELIFTI